MGLTIHYELRLPGSTADADALDRLERLRAYALTLGVERVTETVQITGHELRDARELHPVLSLQWLLCVNAEHICEQRDGSCASICDSDRVAVAGFLMHPGEGCESAVFGLVRPPDPVAADAHWGWQSCCKTQYATAVSDEHFVRCHLSIVDMLEEAQRIGFDVTVHDEGSYWETRSTARLLAEVTHMNRLIAHVAGALADKLAPLKTEGAIFDHPDFERLETEPIEPPDRT